MTVPSVGASRGSGSRRVRSGQNGVHERLDEIIVRHLEHRWRKPVAGHARAAFQQAQDWRRRQASGRPLILDSGCGTGRSTVWLAARHPDALVIGIDQSEARLARGRRRFELPPNALLLRAEVADFWRLALAADWQLLAHYLLYPNPWPKLGHLKRRWHGHPVFPQMLALGGALELRSNWRPYLDEFSRALELAGDWRVRRDEFRGGEEVVTDFEAKYLASGHALFRLRAEPVAARY